MSYNMLKKISLIISFSTLVTIPTTASAAKLYRCNGVVQYRPCSETEANTEDSQIGDKDEVEVSEINFKELENNLGYWKGTIKTNGRVNIWLIFKNPQNTVIQKKLIGIKQISKKLTFSFKTSLPNSENWNWQIRAFKG